MSPLRTYYRLLVWDWVREMRRKRTLISMAMIGLITLFLFSFAIPPTQKVVVDPETGKVILDTRGGILWVTFLLAGTIGIERAFRGDGDGRLLEGLLLAPVGRSTLYLSRISSTFLFVATLEAFILLLFLILFNESLPAGGLALLAGTALLATLGFVEVGVLLSAMTWSLRGGDVLLRILLFPLLIPVLAMAVSLTNDAFSGRLPGFQPVAVLAAFDLVFLGAGQLLFEQVVREVEV